MTSFPCNLWKRWHREAHRLHCEHSCHRVVRIERGHPWRRLRHPRHEALWWDTLVTRRGRTALKPSSAVIERSKVSAAHRSPHIPSPPWLFIDPPIRITALLISPVLGVAITAIMECALPRAILWSQRCAWHANTTVWKTRGAGWRRKWCSDWLRSRSSTWQVTLVMNRVEYVLDEDRGVFL
jgi:hypothetical protein